jgi:hypothetical protein
MRKQIHGMIAGANVATALALTVAVAAAQTPPPQFDLTKVSDHVYRYFTTGHDQGAAQGRSPRLRSHCAGPWTGFGPESGGYGNSRIS